MLCKLFRNMISLGIVCHMVCSGLMVDVIAQNSLGFDKYHNYKEVSTFLRSSVEKYPNLTKLISIGKSIQGRELWLMEISNQKLDHPDDKPAVFICGGLRGDEVAGTEVSLYTIQFLLENYDNEEQIKKVIDSNTFYIIPAVNPDGCDATVKKPGSYVIHNFRPFDNDVDGRIDEDPAEDLNKDGYISLMRVKSRLGDHNISKADPRVMVPVNIEKGEVGEYLLYTEGKDNDDDGKINEDGIGGTNLNHNFPSGWEMEHKQAGAGMYPGSELESEAVMHFLIDHPNVGSVLYYQSGDGVLYRPFDHLADKEIPKVDLEIYKKIGKMYQKITGKKMVNRFKTSTPKESARRSGNRVQTEKSSQEQSSSGSQKKSSGNPVFGTLLDWAYKDYNVYSLSPSLWTLPEEYKRAPDSLKLKIQDDPGWFDFIEKEWAGKGVVDWKSFSHPTLGDVEIGGLCNYYRKNPPAGKLLNELCQKHAEFTMELIKMLPRITIKQIEINPIQIVQSAINAESRKDDTGTIGISLGNKKVANNAMLAEVEITVENIGSFGTRTALGQKTKYSMQPYRSVLVTLESDKNNIEILSVPKVLRLGFVEGSETKENATKEYLKNLQIRKQKGEKIEKEEEEAQSHIKSGSWLIKINGRSTELVFKVISEKSGSIEKRVKVAL